MYKINHRTILMCFGIEEISEDTQRKDHHNLLNNHLPGLTRLSAGKIEERVRKHQKFFSRSVDEYRLLKG